METLKEIYFRDKSDPKYVENRLEDKGEIEILLSKIRMILLTNHGEVLGEPNFGLNLDEYLFSNRINETAIKNDFMTQVSKHIPESRKFQIDCQIEQTSDGVENTLNLNIYINNKKSLTLQF